MVNATEMKPNSKPAAQVAAVPPVAQPVDTPRKAPDPQLKRGDLQLLEFTNCSWRATAPAGVSAKDLDHNDKFWALVGSDIHEFDRIEVVGKDLSFWASYLVTDCGQGYARVKLMYAMELEPRRAQAGKDIPAGWEIVRAGPDERPGYFPRRKSDGHRMGEQPFPDFEGARRHLLDSAIFRNPENSVQYFPR